MGTDMLVSDAKVKVDQPPACVACCHFAAASERCMCTDTRSWEPVQGWFTIPAKDARADKCGLTGKFFKPISDRWLGHNWPLIIIVGIALGALWKCS